MDQHPSDEPLTFRPKKVISISMIALGLPFFALGLLLAVAGELWGVLLAGFSGLSVALGVIYLLPDAVFLRLDPEHFTVRHIFRTWSVPWLMVDTFFVVDLNPLGNPLNPIKPKRVGYNLIRSPGLGGELSIAMGGCEGMLPDNYGKKPAHLAELMNARLLRARSKAVCSSPELASEYESKIVVRNQSVQGAGRDAIREIDITPHSFALRLLRPADYALVVICGFWLLGSLAGIFDSGFAGLFYVVFFLFCVCLGWRQRGAINPRLWKIQLVIFPFLFLFALLALVGSGDAENWSQSEVTQTLLAVLNLVWVGGAALGAMIAITLLSIIKIRELRLSIPKLVKQLRKAGDDRKAPKIVSRENKRRAIILALLGVAVLIGVQAVPLPPNTGTGRPVLKLYQFASLFGFLLLILAQRYLQTPAANLLAGDKRPPVLFLRSFPDDEKPQFKLLDNSFLDFSLETRLAKHFRHFGPFVAVASPRDTIPQLGAARTTVADPQWQSNIVAWISRANAIVLYAGKTHWVNWELARIIDANGIGKLILLVPELKGSRRKRLEETTQRFNNVKQIFQNTLWSSSLNGLTDLVKVRAITFSADGSITAIKCNFRNRDSYHLAALIAHYLNLSVSESLSMTAKNE